VLTRFFFRGRARGDRARPRLPPIHHDAIHHPILHPSLTKRNRARVGDGDRGAGERELEARPARAAAAGGGRGRQRHCGARWAGRRVERRGRPGLAPSLHTLPPPRGPPPRRSHMHTSLPASLQCMMAKLRLGPARLRPVRRTTLLDLPTELLTEILVALGDVRSLAAGEWRARVSGEGVAARGREWASERGRATPAAGGGGAGRRRPSRTAPRVARAWGLAGGRAGAARARAAPRCAPRPDVAARRAHGRRGPAAASRLGPHSWRRVACS